MSFHHSSNGRGNINVLIFISFLHENILWYSLEAPRGGASNAYLQHVFSRREALLMSTNNMFTWSEALLMSTHNIYFRGEIIKIILTTYIFVEK